MVDYKIPTATMLVTTTTIVELHKANNGNVVSERGVQQYD
jgi:hypothetical protein